MACFIIVSCGFQPKTQVLDFTESSSWPIGLVDVLVNLEAAQTLGILWAFIEHARRKPGPNPI